MSKLQNNLRLPVQYGSRELVDEEARLPKTMAHWFRDYGVAFNAEIGTGRGVRRTLKVGCAGPVRYFRALPHCGLLQICDGYFDRWANSVGAETQLPKTRAEFVAAMEFLLASAELANVDPAKEISSLENDLAAADREIEELQSENRDLDIHVRYFGRSAPWIRNLWRRYQRRLSSLRSLRQRISRKLKFQRMRLQ
jgi:hypothetical protein